MHISSTRSASARDSAAMLRRDRGERKTVVLHAKSLRPRDRARANQRVALPQKHGDASYA
jgi:hypothetical protein